MSSKRASVSHSNTDSELLNDMTDDNVRHVGNHLLDKYNINNFRVLSKRFTSILPKYCSVPPAFMIPYLQHGVAQRIPQGEQCQRGWYYHDGCCYKLRADAFELTIRNADHAALPIMFQCLGHPPVSVFLNSLTSTTFIPQLYQCGLDLTHYSRNTNNNFGIHLFINVCHGRELTNRIVLCRLLDAGISPQNVNTRCVFTESNFLHVFTCNCSQNFTSIEKEYIRGFLRGLVERGLNVNAMDRYGMTAMQAMEAREIHDVWVRDVIADIYQYFATIYD